MKEPGVVEEAAVVATGADRAWRAIVDRGERSRWWPDLELELRPGGRLTEQWINHDGVPQRTQGEVVAVEEGHLLRLRWADEGWEAPTDVELRLEDVRGDTRVVVRESGWERLPDGETLADEHRSGWRLHLEHLRLHIQNAPGR